MAEGTPVEPDIVGVLSISLLSECHVVGTPGSGFGPAGEGFFRLSAFGHRELMWKLRCLPLRTIWPCRFIGLDLENYSPWS